MEPSRAAALIPCALGDDPGWHADTLEEYARHHGHADLIRESIDGVTDE